MFASWRKENAEELEQAEKAQGLARIQAMKRVVKAADLAHRILLNETASPFPRVDAVAVLGSALAALRKLEKLEEKT
jgi:hypothetical protein